MLSHTHAVGDCWYRYDVRESSDDFVYIYLSKIRVKRVTDKCVFVEDVDTLEERRILVNATKKYACPTEEEARLAFRRRRELYLEHCKRRYDNARNVLKRMDYLDEVSGWDSPNKGTGVEWFDDVPT